MDEPFVAIPATTIAEQLGLAFYEGYHGIPLVDYEEYGIIALHHLYGRAGIIAYERLRDAGLLNELSDSVRVSDRYAFYVRSNSGDKAALNAQVSSLTNAYGEPVATYTDRSSGLNSKRKGLNSLLDDLKLGKITHVAVTQKDRLARFGVEFLERLLKDAGVTLVILHDEEDKSLQEELMQDFMSLIASFSGKFYRLRGYEQQRKLLEAVEHRMSQSNG